MTTEICTRNKIEAINEGIWHKEEQQKSHNNAKTGDAIEMMKKMPQNERTSVCVYCMLNKSNWTAQSK